MLLKHICLEKFLIVVLMMLSSEVTITSVYGAKILFFPSNVNSHVLYFSRLAVDLAKLGHVTQVLAPSNARKPHFASEVEGDGNFSYTSYPVDGNEPFANSRQVSETIIHLALSRSAWEKLSASSSMVKDFFDHHESDCVALLNNLRLMQQIRGGGFQFAVMDPTIPQCYLAIPYSMGIPYACMSMPVLAWRYRVPRLPSFSSMFGLGYTDQMTLLQRLTTLVFESLLTFQLQNETTAYVTRLAPDRPSLSYVELIRKTSLMFYLEDISIGYALPQMPNTVAVGDIMAGRPGKALPRELDDFISASNDGVMLVSFGSYFDFIPQDIVQKFCDAFTDGRNRLRVVWKIKDTKLCTTSVDGRLKLLPWIPQNDLLADKRVQIFISHGGLNSIIESVYHAKPLIIFPFISDQPANAAAAEHKGFAIRMDIGNFSSEALLSSIEKLLRDPTYRRNAHLSSAILRDRPDTAAQRVSVMIDHVIKYGDQHLRTGAFKLSAAQFFMFDIFAVLVAAGVAVLLSVILTCYCVCRACCGRRKKSKTLKTA